MKTFWTLGTTQIARVIGTSSISGRRKVHRLVGLIQRMHAKNHIQMRRVNYVGEHRSGTKSYLIIDGRPMTLDQLEVEGCEILHHNKRS